ncbi:ComEC/Rec2 family competence protein [Nocardioides sp. AE5]|uniref:ComEC/Rec2 family competence protein n=1 Tax=Nocardioides sp. AE5 TaxID=2962573 RepID=UPI002880EC71|nr:ComEC/Rec2 family competence protein [Nocardioides sp. AE5]MDT0201065.1 ComEC/Rec2 family competence protein [Nocardioides sp. AE5]
MPELEPDPLPPVRDFRMPAAGLAAWAGGIGGLTAPALAPLVLAFVALLGLFMARGQGRSGVRRAIVVWAVIALAVGASAAFRNASVRDSTVAELASLRSMVEVRVTITSDPRQARSRFATSVVMRAVVTEVRGDGEAHPVHTPVLVIADSTWHATELGSDLLVWARLGPAEGHDVAAVLTPRGPPTVIAPPSFLWRGSAVLRASIRDGVAGQPMPQRALVPALVDGDDTAMPEEVQEQFRTTGLTHLLAVSGTNLTLVVGCLLVLGRWCGVRGRWQYLLGALGIVGFILLARTEPSVVRAAAMGTVALIGMGANGTDRGVRALGVAVVALMVWDPWWAITVGFALSVLATAGILLLAPAWAEAMSGWLPLPVAQAIAIPAAAQLACTPVVAAISGQVSLVAVIANLAAAPLVAPATIGGLLGGVLGLLWAPLGSACGWVACWAAKGIIAIAETCSGLTLPAIDWGTSLWPLALLTVLCAVLAVTAGPLLARPATGVGCCVLMVVVVLVPMPTPGWPPGGWVIAVCDVGQGDAVVLNAGNGNGVLIDAGPDPAAVDRCLARLDVEALPVIVLSHFHADHVDGLAGAIDGRLVGDVLISALRDPPAQATTVAEVLTRAGNGGARVPSYGEAIEVGQVRMQVVGPVPGLVFTGNANNSSLVVLAEVRGVSVLLTGDEEPQAQAARARAHPGMVVDVLKVPHHGSRNQDLDHLLSLQPRVAIASVGADNDYGHPSPQTMDPLAEAGAATYRTDRDGDVVVVRSGEGILVRTRG